MNLSIKPENVAYGTTYSFMAGDDKVWRPRTTPCLVPCLKYLNSMEWEGFSEEPIYRPRLRPPPPWTSSLFNTLWFPMSKSQASKNQQEARLRVQELTDSFPPSSIFMFSDGSVQENHNSVCAVYSPSLVIKKSWSLYWLKYFHGRSLGD